MTDRHHATPAPVGAVAARQPGPHRPAAATTAATPAARPGRGDRRRRGHRHHRGLGDGHRGRGARRLRRGLRGGQPRRRRRGDRRPVGRPRTTRSPTRSPAARPPTSAWSAPRGWASSPRPAASTPTPEGLVDEADFFAGAWESTEVGGTSYGVPWYVETRVLYYRTDLAEKAGWDEAPADLGRAEAVRQDLQEQGRRRVRPQPAAPAAPARGRPCCRSRGPTAPTLTNEDGTEYTIDSPGDGRGARLLHVLLRRGPLARPACSTRVSSRAASPTAPTAPSSPARGTPAWSRTPGVEPGRSTPSRRCPAPTARPARRSSAAATSPSSPTPTTRTAPGSSSSGSPSPRPSRRFYDEVGDLPAVQAAWETGELADDPQLQVFGEQLENAVAPPAVPTWEEVAGVDRQRGREGHEGRHARPRTRSPRCSTRPRRSAPVSDMSTTATAPARPPRRRSRDPEPARRPDAAPAGRRRVGARAAVRAAVPGVHRRAGAGQPRHELHRHAAHRHPQPVRRGVRRAATTTSTCVAGPAVPQGHPQHRCSTCCSASRSRWRSRWPSRSGSTGSTRFRGLLPGRLLPAGRDQHRRGLGGLEVPATATTAACSTPCSAGSASTAPAGSTAPRWRCRRWS